MGAARRMVVLESQILAGRWELWSYPSAKARVDGDPARSRFPEGMTERKARATANTGVSPLRCASVEMTAFGWERLGEKQIPAANERKKGKGKGVGGGPRRPYDYAGIRTIRG